MAGAGADGWGVALVEAIVGGDGFVSWTLDPIDGVEVAGARAAGNAGICGDETTGTGV